MKQEAFEKRHDNHWLEFDGVLDRIKARKASQAELADFPKNYRRVCKHLSLARDRRYSARLVDRLNLMVLKAHQVFYQPRGNTLGEIWRFIARDFPRAVRREARLFWLCTFLFYGPFIGMIAAIHVDPELIYTILPPEYVAYMEAMYEKAHENERTIGSDILMFGHYIRHNTGIGLSTFAGGLLAGIGSLFTLLFNGFFLGAVSGHMLNMEYAQNFTLFVCGHGSFELTAIVLSGVAGFRLGLALMAPGRLSRAQALKVAGRNALPIVYGMAGMLFIAAGIEAFWSPRIFPAPIKYGVAALLWTGVFAYLGLAGRSHEH
ncbi:Stage II sporulation protein M [Sulfidibacter corallicola]|uniref:Stage II sporulation protein M n=1 Tax=Sulfidibacter corallicola TaxID=2818388 RepID=A0A8A4TN86_SULCO|nr:stage II sporulation protein M [Sulfidibacter corallicola]QTD51010.1 stage II sporulation protein M [Sulfidibacter corallicola]